MIKEVLRRKAAAFVKEVFRILTMPESRRLDSNRTRLFS